MFVRSWCSYGVPHGGLTPVRYGESRPTQSMAIERMAAAAALIPYPAMRASASDTDGRRWPRSSWLIIGRDTPVPAAARVIVQPSRPWAPRQGPHRLRVTAAVRDPGPPRRIPEPPRAHLIHATFSRSVPLPWPSPNGAVALGCFALACADRGPLLLASACPGNRPFAL